MVVDTKKESLDDIKDGNDDDDDNDKKSKQQNTESDLKISTRSTRRRRNVTTENDEISQPQESDNNLNEKEITKEIVKQITIRNKRKVTTSVSELSVENEISIQSDVIEAKRLRRRRN